MQDNHPRMIIPHKLFIFVEVYLRNTSIKLSWSLSPNTTFLLILYRKIEEFKEERREDGIRDYSSN